MTGPEWLAICLLTLGIPAPLRAQPASFDYGIDAVRMYEIEPASGQKRLLESLAPYLYDIGPKPLFVFEVDVIQRDGSSLLAGRANLKVERYLLLASDSDSTYMGIESSYPDVSTSPAWTYHGPVPLQFTRTATGNSVTFVSAPYQITFLDPEDPITFARPIGYKILGFAYRFALVPARVNQTDSNLRDNALQLEFLRP